MFVGVSCSETSRCGVSPWYQVGRSDTNIRVHIRQQINMILIQVAAYTLEQLKYNAHNHVQAMLSCVQTQLRYIAICIILSINAGVSY